MGVAAGLRNLRLLQRPGRRADVVQVLVRHRHCHAHAGRVAEVVAIGPFVDLATPDVRPRHATLFTQGKLRPDPLYLGIDVADTCAVRNAKGIPSHRLHAVGPPTIEQLWEIVTIPDLRIQVERLARRPSNAMKSS
jgi:uncharacterized NAD(P)/FAD-binding protein YdhS